MSKRHEVLKNLLPLFNDNDILVFVGDGLIKEGYHYDREGVVYIPSDISNITLSMSLGVAMCTDKRVFVFLDDATLIEDLSSILQAGVSRCSNLFYVIFESEHYQDSGFQPVVTQSIRSLPSLLRTSGLTVFDYTLHFEKKKTINGLQGAIKSLVGPCAIIIRVDKGLSRLFTSAPEIGRKHLDVLSEFIQNKSIGTSAYESN